MEILSYINWVDILGAVITILCIYTGLKTGLTAELFRFCGAVLGLVLGIHWYSQAAEVIIVNVSLASWLSQFICFLTLTQLVRLIFKYSILLILKILNFQFAPQLERVGGAIVGFGRGLIIMGTLLLSFNFIPSEYLVDSVYKRSFSGDFLVQAMERTYNILTYWLPEERKEKAVFSPPNIVKD
jgi:uncharacterized membrane protein required for colicin V production